MAENAVDKAFEIIPEVGVDLIGRILPGAIIIFTSIQVPLTKIETHPVLGAVGLTALSYCVGFFADISTLEIARLIERVFFRWPVLKSRNGEIISNKDSFVIPLIKSRAGRRLALKVLGESLLTRTMAFYLFFQAVVSIDSIRKGIKTIFANSNDTNESLISEFRFFNYPSWFAWIAFLFCFFCWYTISRHATKRIYEIAYESGDSPTA